MISAENKWMTSEEIAALALPGVPNEGKNVRLMAERRNWNDPTRENIWWRKRQGRGGGVEYNYQVLPVEAQIKLSFGLQLSPEPETDPQDARSAELWRWFERLPNKKKDEAARRLRIVQAHEALVQNGIPSTRAQMLVARESEIDWKTLHRWRNLVAGHHRTDWWPALAPHHAGRPSVTPMAEQAWDMFKADYLRLEKPPFRSCYRRVADVAAANGWDWPSEATVKRRLERELNRAALILARDGREALRVSYPAQERDRSVFHAMEAVNLDGHKWDVFVKWPDGTVGRPHMLAIQDLYSGKIVAWRMDRTLHSGLVRLAFGDMVELFGIPSDCVMDNGRENAAKDITGGVPTRYRFKVLEEDPVGLLPMMNVKVHWATPYRGQSKPIERGFRDFATETAKHPAFAGAYTGHKPDAKPENYGHAAVAFNDFVKIVSQEIARHNARPGRRSAVCAGRSFDDTFYASLAAAPVRKATEAQRRLFLMAAQGVTAKRLDGSVELFGNRYWSDKMTDLAGQKVVVRFDPQALHAGVAVFRLDGQFVDDLACLDKVGFLDADGARQHARARKDWLRAQTARLNAELRMTVRGLAAAYAEHDAAHPEVESDVQPKVVTPFFGVAGGNALSARLLADPDEDEESEFERGLVRFAEMRRGGGALRVVEGGDD